VTYVRYKPTAGGILAPANVFHPYTGRDNPIIQLPEIGGGGPPAPAFTLSLLHFEGTDGATTMVDEIAGNTPYFNENGEIDTAFFKFGGASGRVHTSANSVIGVNLSGGNTPSGTGDWTHEYFFYLPAAPSLGGLFIGAPTGVTYGAPYARILWDTDFGGSWDWSFHNGTGIFMSGFDDSVGLAAATWHHGAVVRHGDNFYIYLNGSRVVNATHVGQTMAGMSRAGLHRVTLDSNIDEQRVSNFARYTGATYTVPTAPFTVD